MKGTFVSTVIGQRVQSVIFAELKERFNVSVINLVDTITNKVCRLTLNWQGRKVITIIDIEKQDSIKSIIDNVDITIKVCEQIINKKF